MTASRGAWDAVVVGAGPAGATASLRLADRYRVLVLELSVQDSARIGESLPPACRPLLRDLGLLERMDRHRPYLGNRALWGTGRAVTHDFLRDPHGAGWHLDRAAFDGSLRAAAIARGAVIRRGVTLRALTRREGHWGIVTSSGQRIRARLLIDATGRPAAVARRLGARREILDRLTGVYAVLQAQNDDGFSRIEADADGWWYTAPLPGGTRVVAHHTDSDRPVLRALSTADGFWAALNRTRMIAAEIAPASPAIMQGPTVVPAHSAVTHPPAEDGWLAVGDAALALDPLSSQGLMNALFTGMAGGDAAAALLGGDGAAVSAYGDRIAAIRSAYEVNLAYFYEAEAVRRDGEFWTRRTGAGQPEISAARRRTS